MGADGHGHGREGDEQGDGRLCPGGGLWRGGWEPIEQEQWAKILDVDIDGLIWLTETTQLPLNPDWNPRVFSILGAYAFRRAYPRQVAKARRDSRKRARRPRRAESDLYGVVVEGGTAPSPPSLDDALGIVREKPRRLEPLDEAEQAEALEAMIINEGDPEDAREQHRRLLDGFLGFTPDETERGSSDA